jgi:hypothetical protein
VISVYDLLDHLAAAAGAADAGDDGAYDAHAAAFQDGVAGTAGAIAGYEVDYVLRDLAAGLELGEPAAAGAARIRAALERLRDAGL